MIAVTAPITNSGTSTSANLGIQSGTTSQPGAVQLTDSTDSTSTTTAATPNSVKTAVDRWRDYLHSSATALDVFPRYLASTNIGSVSGRAWATYVTAPYDMTVSQITFVGGTTASSGLTLARFGLYTGGVLVARTANDTTLFNSASTVYTRSFDTAGGYPASYTLTAGTRYAVVMVQVGTTIGSAIGMSVNNGINLLSPQFCGIVGSQTDLPASPPSGSSTTMLFARLS